MSRKIRLWYVCGIVALGLLLPGFALGQEAPTMKVIKLEEIVTPDLNISQDEKPITLEELEKMFGAHNVCGVNCGFIGDLPCWKACGDSSARCFSHHCIYMRD